MQQQVYGPDRNAMANLIAEQAKEVDARCDFFARVVCLQLVSGGGYNETLQRFQQAEAESSAKWSRFKKLLEANQK